MTVVHFSLLKTWLVKTEIVLMDFEPVPSVLETQEEMFLCFLYLVA